MPWIIVGLAFDVAGTLILASPLFFVSRKKAEKLGATLFGGNPLQVQDRLRQSKMAKWGALLIIIGFLLQIYGNIRQVSARPVADVRCIPCQGMLLAWKKAEMPPICQISQTFKKAERHRPKEGKQPDLFGKD
jgi:hypothetical protein